MKTINELFMIVFLMLSFQFALCQEKVNCQVVGGEIDAIYVGKCKDGFASGEGVLRYTNSNGKYMFVGNFKKGKMHGKGQLFVFDGGEKKLIREGVWKRSVFKGEKRVNDKPYEIKSRFNLDRYSLKKISDGNQVRFKFNRNGGTNSVTNLTIEGDSGIKEGITFDGSNDNQGYSNVEFPFSCRVNYTTANKMRSTTFDVRFEFIINEPGVWEIVLTN